MNPEDTSNAHSLFGDRGPSSSGGGGSGSSGGGGGLSLAQQLQYQQLLHQQMQMQQQLHEQQHSQSLGMASSTGGVGGGLPQQQRDLALEQYAAARQQAIREAVLSHPYTLNSASLLQQQHQPHQPQYPQQQSQSHNPMMMAQGSGSSLPYSSSSNPNVMGFLPGLVSQLPPYGSSKVDATTGNTSLVQPGHLLQAPSSTVSLSREESMLVEEAVLRGLPLEEVFRAAGMSALPNRPQPMGSRTAEMMMPPPPPSQASAAATAIARRLSSMEQNQPLGFGGGGGGGGGGTGRILGSPPFMSGMDPSQVIAQRELLLSTAAAASSSSSATTAASSQQQHGADLSWWLPPAKKSRRSSSDALHDALKKPKKKPPPSQSSSTSGTPSRRGSGPPPDAKSPAVSKTMAELSSSRLLPSAPALASALPPLRGCSFPMPPRGSSSTTHTKKPAAQSPSKQGGDDDSDDDSSESSPSSAAAPGATKLGGAGASASDEDQDPKAGWSVGSLASFQALWDKLGSSRSSRRSEAQGQQHPQQVQREVFRRKVGDGSVTVDPASSRSAVALYDRLRLREQEVQQQQQRELDEQRLLLLQLRSRGL